MEKEAIADLIESKHTTLLTWLQNQPNEHWELCPENKWTTGQHTLHLLQTLEALNKALSMPKFLLRFKFGKTNREIRNYQTVVQRYEDRLKDAKGITYKASQNMKIPHLEDKIYFINRIQTEYKKLVYKTVRISDTNLDTVVLPHPLMGKMPVRELLMWSAHHTEHHTATLIKNYSFDNSN